MKTIVFYLNEGQIIGVTKCSDDHAALQSHPHTQNALLLDGLVDIDSRTSTVVDGRIAFHPPKEAQLSPDANS